MGVQGIRVGVEEGVHVEVEMEEVETVGVEEGWEVKFSSVNTPIQCMAYITNQYHVMETVCEVVGNGWGGVMVEVGWDELSG